MRILICNDDGIDSLLLEYLIEALEPLAELEVVVPRREQSWKAKAITRYGDLRLERHERRGRNCYTVDGTPADCVNAGVHHIYKYPDLVIAGINIGNNTGHCLVWSSGTVGACLEANLAGIPAVAISQVLDEELYTLLRTGQQLEAAEEMRLRRQTHLLLQKLFHVVLNERGLHEGRLTWNVNLPLAALPDAEIRFVPVARDRYLSLFRRHDDGFVHELLRDNIVLDESDDADTKTSAAGHVAVSELDLWALGSPRPERLAALRAAAGRSAAEAD